MNNEITNITLHHLPDLTRLARQVQLHPGMNKSPTEPSTHKVMTSLRKIIPCIGGNIVQNGKSMSCRDIYAPSRFPHTTPPLSKPNHIVKRTFHICSGPKYTHKCMLVYAPSWISKGHDVKDRQHVINLESDLFLVIQLQRLIQFL